MDQAQEAAPTYHTESSMGVAPAGLACEVLTPMDTSRTAEGGDGGTATYEPQRSKSMGQTEQERPRAGGYQCPEGARDQDMSERVDLREAPAGLARVVPLKANLYGQTESGQIYEGKYTKNHGEFRARQGCQ